MDAVAAGFRAHEQEGVARAARLGAEDAAGADEAHAHCVHERVAVVRRGEHHLAPDRGDAETVAVAPDAADHAFEQIAVVAFI